MILQALNDYYRRKPELPKAGYELKEIPFLLELDADGQLIQVVDTREQQGKKKLVRAFLVPQGVKKSVNVAANLLWGNAEYVLGLPDAKKLAEREAKGKASDYMARLLEMREAFDAEIRALPDAVQQDKGIRAVLAFMAQSAEELSAQLGEAGGEIAKSNPNLTFRLRGDIDLVCQRPAVSSFIMRRDIPTSAALCLVIGEADDVERLHPSITGVRDAQSSGASLVSFNLDAFRSYGKEQGGNAPVGKRAAFAYATALKHLLRRDSPQKLQVGDATTVFWADHDSSLENDFAAFFDEPRKEDPDPDRGTRAVAALLESVRQGVGPVTDNQTRFFVLGLAPNAARIAIRFWQVGTVAEMATRIVRHFDNIKIDEPGNPPFLSLRLLLRAIAQPSEKWPGGDPEKVPPNLGGELIRAILEDSSYPETLFHGAIRRIRAEREITYPRAAILKACINRKRNPNEKEITVSLDFTNTNPGYRLGRLFAVLERVQEEANPRINATIRDRYYGAFSAVPSSVFSTLMRLKNHHLAKLVNAGRRINLERLIGEIVDGLPPTLPSHLSLADQGRFAIGYYHQRMNPATYGKQGDPK